MVPLRNLQGTDMPRRRPKPTEPRTRPFARLWREWLRKSWKTAAFAFAMMVIVAAASGGYTKLIQEVMNAFEDSDFSVIWWGPAGVVILTAMKGLADYYRETSSNRFVTRMEADLQKEMFRQLVGSDLARLATEAPAGLAARFSSDIALISGAVRGAMGGLSGILIMVFSFAAMLTIDVPLTLAMILIFGIAVLPVNLIGSRLKKLSRKTQAEISSMTSEVTEGLSGIRMARTYQLEEPLSENAASVFERLFGLKNKQNRWSARVSPLMETLAGGAVAVLLLVVGIRMSHGTISIADFTGLLTGLGVASGPARRLGSTYAQMQQGAGALERVFMLFDAKNTIVDGSETITRAKGEIRFEAVQFAYPNGHVALKDFTLDIPAGTRTAFVGRSGAGKSTVFNLLPRLYDPTGGRVLLDGHDLRDLTLTSLRDQIAVVSQDSILLSASVAQNIGFGRRSASRDEIEAAARDAAADGFISALPDAYETRVNPSAGQFSGGERQRLSIARAILRDAPILLLDEPTSALDAESEAAIRGALDRLAAGRTTLVIAHRLATILDADHIVVMDRGRIVEQGTHQELLDLGGLYADLYALQFAGA